MSWVPASHVTLRNSSIPGCSSPWVFNVPLHTVVASRIQYQPATQAYVARRTAQGKTNREIKRCLARYVARDLYRLLENTAVGT